MSRVTPAPDDMSLEDPNVSAGRRDVSCIDRATTAKNCSWCLKDLAVDKRHDSKFCSKKCRQASWRFGVSRSTAGATDRPMVFAYADPPYPGKAFYYPEKSEVDHVSLLERLIQEYPDGWALSTSSRSLRDVLQLCPPGVRVCAWFKGPRPARSRFAIQSWEPLIVSGGRTLLNESPCTIADGLIARGRFRAFPGAMIGMKPPTFAEWMFRLLGATCGDELHDLFPGSGAITVAWKRFTKE